MSWRIVEGDCVDVMAAMPEASVDAVVCDPPYGLEFMGKGWDKLDGGSDVRQPFRGEVQTPDNPYGRTPVRYGYDQAPQAMQSWHEVWAREALRVLKPGGHLLAFSGTRTSHRMVCAIEDAGFEVRDQIAWLYGSGFPKSLNLEAEREGWGTALKPAHEPICVARKSPIGTVAANMRAHGTGGINVDGCRIEHSTVNGGNLADNPHLRDSILNTGSAFGGDQEAAIDPAGRWPANVLLDPEAAAMLDEQTGTLKSGAEGPSGLVRNGDKFRSAYGDFAGSERERGVLYGDSGGASRFFYCAKASSAERNAGLDGFEAREAGNFEDDAYEWATDGRGNPRSAPIRKANVHPTVKPIDLMRWLVRLVTPPGGTVLDPFAGSGTTGCSALLEGFGFIGIEREAEYATIARARIGWWEQHPEGMALVKRLEAEATQKAVADSGQLDIFGATEMAS